MHTYRTVHYAYMYPFRLILQGEFGLHVLVQFSTAVRSCKLLVEKVERSLCQHLGLLTLLLAFVSLSCSHALLLYGQLCYISKASSFKPYA